MRDLSDLVVLYLMDLDGVVRDGFYEPGCTATCEERMHFVWHFDYLLSWYSKGSAFRWIFAVWLRYCISRGFIKE